MPQNYLAVNLDHVLRYMNELQEEPIVGEYSSSVGPVSMGAGLYSSPA